MNGVVGGDDEKGPQQEPQSNLWREFLKTAAKSGGRGLQSTGHLVVLGAEASGKSTLVSSFGSLESRFEQMKEFLMMRYAYCHLQSHDAEDAYSLLNIWQISEPKHAEVLSVVVPAEDMERMSYLIVLDLAHPDSVEAEFKRWMETVAKIHSKLIARCGDKKAAALKEALSKHIRFYVNPKDDIQTLAEDDDADAADGDGDDDDGAGTASNDGDAEEKEEAEAAVAAAAGPSSESVPAVNLGVPVIVVANKCDAFRKHFEADADAEDHFEIMCSWIRWWAMEYGAASFSMQKGLKEQSRRILSYVDHRVFGSKFDRGPNHVVKLANLAEGFLFIPSGADSIETIRAQNPNRNFQEMKFADFFKGDPSKKKRHLEAKPKMQAEPNERFLKTMQFVAKNGDRTQGVRGGGARGAEEGYAYGK